MKTNVVIFATYRNEISWIRTSLKQIEKIDPVEVIICDCCFDPKIPNYSTDGTREIIQEWVANREGARMISAVRVPSKIHGFFGLLKNFKFPYFIRLYTAAIAMIENIYRINQALTFNYMRKISKHCEEGGWFMNYDADQFYSDEVIANIKKYCNGKNHYGLLTANENTFFENFEEYTDEYEKRHFNNMPHRIYKNTFVKPTRDNHREYIFSRKYYKDDKNVKSKSIGTYNHYKFKPNDKSRFAAGYSLGDRKMPDVKKYNVKKYKGKHPNVIVENILNKE